MSLEDLKRTVFDLVHRHGRPTDEILCTCSDPCCEADIGIGYVNCGAQHCVIHATAENQGVPSYDTYSGRSESWTGDREEWPYDPPRRPDKVHGKRL